MVVSNEQLTSISQIVGGRLLLGKDSWLRFLEILQMLVGNHAYGKSIGNL